MRTTTIYIPEPGTFVCVCVCAWRCLKFIRIITTCETKDRRVMDDFDRYREKEVEGRKDSLVLISS